MATIWDELATLTAHGARSDVLAERERQRRPQLRAECQDCGLPRGIVSANNTTAIRLAPASTQLIQLRAPANG